MRCDAERVRDYAGSAGAPCGRRSAPSSVGASAEAQRI
jgi:hypothetical protein